MSTQIALIVTPIASARALAGVGKLAGVRGQAFVTGQSHGAVLLLENAEYAAAHEACALLSKTLRGIELVLVRRGSSEDPADSDVQAQRYAGGKSDKKLAPGLILSGLDEVCERLILGTLQPVDLKDETDAVDTQSLSKIAALRALRSASKKNS